MAGTLMVGPTESVLPTELIARCNISYQDLRALKALDSARQGLWEEFFVNIRPDQEAPVPDALLKELYKVPPVEPSFTTWDQLDQHLLYVSKCADLIRANGL